MPNLKLLLAALFFLVLTGFVAWWLGTDLLADFQNRTAKLEPVRDLRITEARCRSKLFVISICDIKVAGPGAPGGQREINYLIVGGVGDARVSLQRAAGPGPATSRHLTTDYGMENLVNRLASFSVFVILLLVATVAGLIAAFRGKRSSV